MKGINIENYISPNKFYYIPDLSEFKQGFDFEVANVKNLEIMDFSKEEVDIEHVSTIITWEKWKIDWMHPDTKMVTNTMPNGVEISMLGSTYNMLHTPFDIEISLKHGHIRRKIDKIESYNHIKKNCKCNMCKALLLWMEKHDKKKDT